MTDKDKKEPALDVVWESGEQTGRYRAQAVRAENPRVVKLQLVEIPNGKVLREQEFGLTYLMAFGPDAADMRIWNMTATRWMEEDLTEKKPKTPAGAAKDV